jgi:hypothetical protein
MRYVGSIGERQLTALVLHGDVAAFKAAKVQYVEQCRVFYIRF